MNALRFSLIILAAIVCGAMARKPALTVRFHLESVGAAGAPFALPAKFRNPPRDGFIASVASISDRNIVAIHPTPGADGTWGCAFKLDQSGKFALETLSREHRGSSLVGFVSTKTGTHQLPELLIDRPVTDGIIYLPGGLTAAEIVALRKRFKLFGQPATPAPRR